MTRKICTLVYALRDGQVLMMLRRKQPNLGQWIAPGGKVELDESPMEGAVRELAEETGLRAVGRPELRLIITETSPLPDWQWLMFVYLVREFEGELSSDGREGELAWVPIDQVATLPIPQADAIFFPWVIDGSPGPLSLKFEYDADLHLLDWRIE
ncbi:MAG TPA: 8-oxo-dGTP diphosphatase [Anaerolineae bacterium]|nr:8-oxo-dGTP diphosphatase [Anaerolineae bacterium]HNU05211.1 8-oxo-dGTP diphosphatase [Anaerolineae bacterium]